MNTMVSNGEKKGTVGWKRPVFAIFLSLLVTTVAASEGPKKRDDKRTGDVAAAACSLKKPCYKICMIGLAAIGAGTFLAYHFGLLKGDPNTTFKEHLKSQNIRPPARLEIVHVGQTHDSPEMWKESNGDHRDRTIREVLNSQLAIADMLLQVRFDSTMPPPFAEGITMPLTRELQREVAKGLKSDGEIDEQPQQSFGTLTPMIADALAEVKQFFPTGYPKEGAKSGTLTTEQQVVLIHWGAPLVLWILGEIAEIQPAGTYETEVATRKLVEEHRGSRRDYVEIVLVQREIDALSIITKYKIAHPEKTKPALLIFGVTHDFKQYEQPWLSVRESPMVSEDFLKRVK